MDYGSLWGECVEIKFTEAIEKVPGKEIPYSVSIHWELFLAMRQSQETCTLDATGADVPEHVLKAQSFSN